MQVTLVYIHVEPEHVAAFIAITKKNHEGSRREAGNLRFDLLQTDDDPTRFVLIEAYLSTDDVVAHKATPHYLAWREAVDPWMASPRKARRYVPLAPDDPGLW